MPKERKRNELNSQSLLSSKKLKTTVDSFQGGREQSEDLVSSARRCTDSKSMQDESELSKRWEQMTRLERKRHQERIRRGGFKRAFDALYQTLLKVDPVFKETADARRARRLEKKSTPTEDDENQLFHRPEMLHRAITRMEELYEIVLEQQQILMGKHHIEKVSSVAKSKVKKEDHGESSTSKDALKSNAMNQNTTEKKQLTVKNDHNDKYSREQGTPSEAILRKVLAARTLSSPLSDMSYSLRSEPPLLSRQLLPLLGLSSQGRATETPLMFAPSLLAEAPDTMPYSLTGLETSSFASATAPLRTTQFQLTGVSGTSLRNELIAELIRRTSS